MKLLVNGVLQDDLAKLPYSNSLLRGDGLFETILTIDQNAVGKLKRRQAVGKNSQGIILVKGDPSFSSSDQILINELAFYIQSNNLKAF